MNTATDTPNQGPMPTAERVFLAAACALMLFVPLAITYLTTVDHFKWLFLDTLAPLLALAVVVRRLLTPGERIVAPLLVWAALAYVVTTGISIAAATNQGLALSDTTHKFALFCILVVTAHLAQRRSARDALLWTVAGTGLLASAYGIAQHFGYDFFPWTRHLEVPVERGISAFGHSTFAASFLILAIPLTAGLMLSRTGWLARLGALVCLAPMVYHLSFTGARGAAAAITVTAIATFALIVWRMRQAGVAFTGPKLAAAVTAGLIFVAGGGALMVSAWQEKESDLAGFRQGAAAVRIFTWETGARLFLSHPLLGVGGGNYEIASPAAWNPVEAERFVQIHRRSAEVHNEYLEAAAEQGVLGVAALLAVIVSGLGAALAHTRKALPFGERALAWAVFATLTAGALDALLIFNFQTPASAMVYWAVLGVAAAGHGQGGPS